MNLGMIVLAYPDQPGVFVVTDQANVQRTLREFDAEDQIFGLMPVTNELARLILELVTDEGSLATIIERTGHYTIVGENTANLAKQSTVDRRPEAQGN